MQIKKPIIILTALFLISGTLVGAYTSVSGVHLPDQPVTIHVHDGSNSYFDILLSNVPAGNDVSNGWYFGWCADRSVTMPRDTDLIATLYDSYDPALPAAFQDSDWGKVNWILNHRDGYSVMDIQWAFWNLIDEYDYNSIPANSQELVNDSEAGYEPQAGDILAIVVVPVRADAQCTFIELRIPSLPGTCRWTGGGTIGTNRDPRVTHGFELHCNVNQLPNNLEVNWGGDHFHLDVLTQVECSDDPGFDPMPPRASCDTIHGWGEGKYNNHRGYLVEFIFTDAGEPGRGDWAWIKITNSNGDPVMEVSGFLKSGNQQAHRCTGIDA
jgi:hypothetical protein